MSKPLLHIVAGPTASGKTKFAIELAQQVNGELINADSRQIYKYLDIGTNKGKLNLTDEEEINGKDYPVYTFPSSNVLIHLLSFLNPDQEFSVYEFQLLALQLIKSIIKKGKTPILVGGTGLYIAAVMHPEKYKMPSVSSTEQKIKLSALTVSQLQGQLKELDIKMFDKMNSSDQQNPRRLINAIIKATAPKSPATKPAKSSYDIEVHNLTKSLDELTPAINQRVVEMFEQGMLDEVKHVLKLGFPPKSVALQGIGYREVLQFLDSEINLDKCIQLVQIAHRQYARRQITWFKKYL